MKQNKNKTNKPKQKVTKLPAAQIVTTSKTPRAVIKPLDNNGGIIIEHEEYVDDLSASTLAENNYRWNLNPGNLSLFPWLSKIARGYENYRFEEVELRLRPFAATTATGNSMLAHDPDASDSFPSNMRGMSAFEHKQQPLYGKEAFHIPKKNLNMMGPNKFVSTSANLDGVAFPLADQAALGDKVKDSGSIFIKVGVSSIDASFAALWIKYRVKLYAPTAEESGSASYQLVGASSSDLGSTSAYTYGSLIWRVSPGVYQGPIVPPGNWLIFGRFRVSGGGTATALDLLAYSGSALVTALSAEIGLSDYDKAFYVVNTTPVQLNFSLTTSGTVTEIKSDIYMCEYSATGYHAIV